MSAVLQFAPDDLGWSEIFRQEFSRIRSQHALYPEASGSPSAALESVAGTVRAVATNCLPLGLAIVMHLYPVCVLQCAPLPRLGVAGFKRHLVMKYIRERALIVANAGSERAHGAQGLVTARISGDDLLVSGTFEYVSLASVADLVLFSAVCDQRTVFCAAELRGETVRVGAAKFAGRMQLSDTHSLTFVDHPVTRGRFLVVDDAPGARCIFDYQRCWFHLLLADAYLARIEYLRRKWQLAQADEHRMALNEVNCLREYSLRLLDDCRPHGGVDRLAHVTSALKLRVSTMAQATGRLLRDLVARTDDDATRLSADASELGYMRLQPTSDDRILGNLAPG